MLHNKQIAALILKYLRAELTPAEEVQFKEWFNADPRHASLVKQFENEEWVLEEMKVQAQRPLAKAEENLWAKWEQVKNETKPPIENKKTHEFTRYMVAAAVIAVIVVGILYTGRDGSAKKSSKPVVARIDSAQTHEPGKDKAMLILADGTKYILNDTVNGLVAKQGNVQFTKEDDTIFCKTVPGNIAPQTIGFNILKIPKGGSYQLVLPDGSKVWLNAETRIQFPTVDTGNKRIVKLVGEAYFEVTKNKHKPFIVKANDAEVKVFGTHFNVIAYPNERLSKATLMEGSITVTSGGKEELITPSHSALFTKGSKPTIIKEDHIDKIIAWKNQQFLWKGDSLTTALREIERWYNVHVKYIGPQPTTILGYVFEDRTKTLKDLMNLLTSGTSVYYKLESSTLFISSSQPALKK